MKLVVAGGTGFIGSALCSQLIEQGHSLALLTRFPFPTALSSSNKIISWGPESGDVWEQSIDGADGVINLAGEPIAAKRWTAAQKEKIRSSRIETTRSLVQAMAKAERKPKFLVNASAIGYYGSRGDETITDEGKAGSDFLAQVCADWEEEAKKAETLGIRVARVRTGIVLGEGGGALAKMTLPFKFFVGGPLGSGRQWMPWIHIEDEVGLIIFLCENTRAQGAFNATSPNPATMSEFCKTLGAVLSRPSWAPVPAFALRLLLGEMAGMLLTGQRALPLQVQRLGYAFKYPSLFEALQSLSL